MRPAQKRRSLVIGEVLEARCVLDSTVVFNELFYHPLDTIEGDAVEWIELYNQNGVDVELSHWTLDGGVRYEFPAGTILPGQQQLVIASDPIRLQQQTGLENVFGPFEGNLSNGGELVELRSHTNRIMDQVRYDDQTPWPLAADGTGLTLAKRFEDKDSASAQNWTVSAQPNGTPGQPNFSAASDRFESLVDTTTSLHYAVISADDGLANNWTLSNFDTANWPQVATNQIGYDVTGFGPASLVRHYSLDQNLEDSTGIGPIGQTTEATFTAEHSPALGSTGSLSFDGTNDEVVIPDAETSEAYTMSIWVKPDRITGQGIVFRSAVSPLLFWSHALRMTADGYFEAYAVDGGGT
ncbi:MAG: lamin tail domain-containing protein, partial [Planctomycetales bacterium]|nr:lamin tail domain-containing protein [Planctomycetales bacterium]